MAKKNKFDYDVFISYSHQDKNWVRGTLLTRLEKTGLKVFIDFRDFKIGAANVKEMERGVAKSRKTLIVLTPEYLKSGWTEFETLMAQTLSPVNRDLRVVPILRKKCSLPISIGYMNYIDFVNSKKKEFAWKRLIDALVSKSRSIPKILVVDDESDVQKTIGGLLEDAKYKVFVAGDEDSALEILKQENTNINFAIIDIHLHGKSSEDEDGLKLANTLYALAPQIQTVILSGSTEARHIISAFNFGVVDYVVKTPGWEDRLLKVIKEHIKKPAKK
jgi:CheY-like chemotaxis protein